MSKTLKAIIRNLIITAICLFITMLEGYLDSTLNIWTNIYQYGVKYIFIILAFIIASEATLYIEKKYRQKKVSKNDTRRKHQVIACTKVIAIYIIIFCVYIFSYKDDLQKEKSAILYIVFGAIYVIMFDLILLTRNYHQTLQKERDTNTKLREEKLKSDLKALQKQINPHFLFNSLNVLVSEIYFDQEKAVKYTQHLSDIYRYVLQSSEKYLVPLQEELTFLQSFIYMYKTKYDDGFQVKIDIENDMLNHKIPTLALQTLVENCLKHNAILSDQPLLVKIYSNKENITVSNNITQTQNNNSSSTGLKNLANRYKLLSNKEIDIEKTTTEFKVTIPLL